MKQPFNRLASVSEKDVEVECDKIAAALGLVKLSTPVKLRGKRAGSHSTGQSKGIPDRFYRKPRWPKWFWIGVELKKPVGWKWSSDEQEALHAAGHTALAHSAEDLIAIVKEADRAWVVAQ